MKKTALCFVAILLLQFTAGCSTSSDTQTTVKQPFFLVVETTEQKLTGNTFDFHVYEKPVPVFEGQEATVAPLKEKLFLKMTAAGFNPGKTYRKSHTTAYVNFGKPSLADVKFNEAKASGEYALDGEIFSINFGIYAKTYGKRPAPILTVSIYGTKENLTNPAVLNPQLDGVVGMVSLTPPKKNMAMKGDPGCFPRVGYDTSNVLPGKTDGYYISEVVKKSAADKAGLKLGDKLITIDGKTTDFWVSASKEELAENAKKYDQGKPILMALERNGKKIDLAIKPKIECENR